MVRRQDVDVVDAFYHAFRSDGLAIARVPQGLNPLGPAYLGHRSIQHTVRYTELAPR
jgi:hypothetical protein